MNNGRRIYHGVQEEYTEVTEGKRKERASLFRKSLFHLKTPCPPLESKRIKSYGAAGSVGLELCGLAFSVGNTLDDKFPVVTIVHIAVSHR